MKIVKEDNLSVVKRAYVHGGVPILIVAPMVGFSLLEKGRIADEQSFWKAAQILLEKNDFLEGGIFPKPTGEVLLRSRCYPPGGKPVPACPVSFRVGAIQKSLYVFGDRHWIGAAGVYTGISDPVPFTEMDISWENAFGGPGTSNTKGKGISKCTDGSGHSYIPLPNIEDPHDLVCVPGKVYRPRSFDYAGSQGTGLLDHWRKFAGTFDEDWLVHNWPYLPKDFNAQALHAAQEDQRLKEGYFRGDEPIVLENMHPTEPVIRAALPGIRMRLFTRSIKLDLPVFEEHQPCLDKIWLFPHLGKGIAIWHAMITVGNEDADNVTHLVVYKERLDEPARPASFYEAMTREEGQDKAADVSAAPKEETREAPDAPKDVVPPGPGVVTDLESVRIQQLLKETETEVAEKQAELNGLLKKMGIDPAKLPQPAPEGAPARGASEHASLEDMLKAQEAETAQAEKELKGILTKMGVDPAKMPEAPEPPPVKSPAELLDVMKIAGLEGTDAFQMIAGLGATLASLEKEEVELVAALKERAEAEAPEAARAEEPPPDSAPSVFTREDVLSRYAAGADLSGLDLSGLDLSGCSLAGARMRRTVLERTNLSGSDLSGADLADAVLALADCTGVKMTGSNLENASLAGINGQKADMTGASLVRSDLSGADLAGSSLANTNTQETIFRGTVLKGCSFAGSSGDAADLAGADLGGAILSGCSLTRPDFSSACLDNADCSNANMPGASFHGTHAERANFSGSNLTGSRSASGSYFKDADFQGTKLGKASFQQCTFENCSFSSSDLDSALFMKCRLNGSIFYRASARHARFDRSDLTGARMVAVNLFQGSLHKTILNRCDLEGSNLFGVDLYKAFFRETDLRVTNLTRTLLEKAKPVRL